MFTVAKVWLLSPGSLKLFNDPLVFKQELFDPNNNLLKSVAKLKIGALDILA